MVVLDHVALVGGFDPLFKRAVAPHILRVHHVPSDLANATGMNRPSLYAAFGDKRSLYVKTLERYRDQARAQAAQLLADDPPLRVYLERFYQAALDVYVAGSDACGCYSIGTAATEAAVDPAVRAFLAESIRNSDRFFAGLIRKGWDRREAASECDSDALARLATATLHTIAVRSRAGFPREELDGLAAAAIEVICGPQRVPLKSAPRRSRAAGRGKV